MCDEAVEVAYRSDTVEADLLVDVAKVTYDGVAAIGIAEQAVERRNAETTAVVGEAEMARIDVIDLADENPDLVDDLIDLEQTPSHLSADDETDYEGEVRRLVGDESGIDEAFALPDSYCVCDGVCDGRRSGDVGDIRKSGVDKICLRDGRLDDSYAHHLDPPWPDLSALSARGRLKGNPSFSQSPDVEEKGGITAPINASSDLRGPHFPR